MSTHTQRIRINDSTVEHIMKSDGKYSSSRLLSFKVNHTNRRHRQLHLYWPLSWIIFMLTLSSVSAEMIYRVDPLGKYLLQIILLGFFLHIPFWDEFRFFWLYTNINFGPVLDSKGWTMSNIHMKLTRKKEKR